jgi:hypothetical protein
MHSTGQRQLGAEWNQRTIICGAVETAKRSGRDTFKSGDCPHLCQGEPKERETERP